MDYVSGATSLTETLLYGEVLVRYEENTITASYSDDPHTVAVIRRSGGRTHSRTPIGTRSGAHIHAQLEGRTVVFSPGKARLLKRSYRVGIEFDGLVRALTPKNLEDSTLLDGASNNGDNTFGDFTRAYGGAVDVLWSLPFKFGKRTVEPPTPSRDDVIVGILAAAAFGTGGLSATLIVMGAVDSILPG